MRIEDKIYKQVFEPAIFKIVYLCFFFVPVFIFLLKYEQILNEIKSDLLTFILLSPSILLPLTFGYIGLEIIVPIKIEKNKIYIWKFLKWEEIDKSNIEGIDFSRYGLIIKGKKLNLYHKMIIFFNFTPIDKQIDFFQKLKEVVGKE